MVYDFLFGNLSIPCSAPLCHSCLSQTPGIQAVQDFSAPLRVETVAQWLKKQNITFSQILPEQVPLETQKGLAVFNLITDSIPEQTSEAMTKKFGDVIELVGEYQQKVKSLPNRPQNLKVPEQTVIAPKIERLDAVVNSSTIPSSDKLDLSETQNNSGKNTNQDTVNQQTVTIQDLRDWYVTAEKLARTEPYKQRITEVANHFKQTQQLLDKALASMKYDTQQHQDIIRISQIVQRIGAVLGKTRADGSSYVQGKMYDIAFDPNKKNFIIANKSGEVVLGVQSGNITLNQVSPAVVTHFDEVNAKLDDYVKKNQNQDMER